MIVLTAIFSCLIGVTVGMFLTYQLMISYDEFRDVTGNNFNDLEAALPSNYTINDNAIVKDEPRRLVGDTDEIRAIFAKRRQNARN